MLKGRTYEEIYGSATEAKKQIEKRGNSERMVRLHAEGKFKDLYFNGNILNRTGYSNYYDYWLNKFGIEVANDKRIQMFKNHSDGAKHLKDPELIAIRQEKTSQTIMNWPAWRKFEDSMLKSLRMFKITSNPVWREEQSIKITELIASGQWQPFNNHKNGTFIARNGSKQKYASSWELARMLQLEDLGCVWTKNHKIRIPYTDLEGNKRNYVPDILVDDTFLEEIKPDSLLEYSFNQIKIAAGYEFCKNNNLEFRIINSEMLGSYIEKANIYHEQQKNEN